MYKLHIWFHFDCLLLNNWGSYLPVVLISFHVEVSSFQGVCRWHKLKKLVDLWGKISMRILSKFVFLRSSRRLKSSWFDMYKPTPLSLPVLRGKLKNVYPVTLKTETLSVDRIWVSLSVKMSKELTFPSSLILNQSLWTNLVYFVGVGLTLSSKVANLYHLVCRVIF